MCFFNALKIALVVAGMLWVGPVFAQAKSSPVDTEAQQSKPSSDAKSTTAGQKVDATAKGQVGTASAAAKAQPAVPGSSTGAQEPKAEAGKAASGPAAASGSAAQPTTGAAKPSGADTGQVDGSTYVVRMRDLAQRIDELKEQIRRSHTRLSLLSETILSGGAGGARAEVSFTNEMSSAFRLVRALFVLDGAVQYNKQDDTGGLAEQKSIPIFSGSIPPGDHTLQVLIKLQGYGYGVFSYLRGYKFEVKSTHSFTVTEGKTMHIEAIAWEKGGVTTPLEQRPAIRYVQKIGTEAVGRPEPASARGGSSQVKAGASVGVGGQ